VVVIHDPTLDRTTTGTGPVRQRTLVELQALRLKERGGAVVEERVPTLDQVVALAVAGKRQILLEIKTDEQRQRYPGIEEKVFAVLDRHRFVPFTVLMAFEGATWRRVRQLRPEARVAALYSACCRPRRGADRALPRPAWPSSDSAGAGHRRGGERRGWPVSPSGGR
jgi:glycerophosphoryl diester phosphodiesterase